SVLGNVSSSGSIVAESHASTGATVAFPAENGTLLLREQERSCLTNGCALGAAHSAASSRPRRPSAPSRQSQNPWRPGWHGGGVGQGRCARSYLFELSRAGFRDVVNLC